METQFTIPALNKVYASHSNYKVVTGNAISRKKKVILFFSGNGLYYPNTSEVFEEIILQKDRYEWENIARSLASDYHELIFIRDVYKTWYSEGVSAESPSIEATLSRLKKLTEKADYLVCVGNSAGGYAALLFGSLLKANAIFSFSGFVNLDDEICNDPLNPKLKEAKVHAQKKQWLDIRELLYTCSSEIFYFYPVHATIDKKQHAYLKSAAHLNCIAIDSDLHGIGPSGKTYAALLTVKVTSLKSKVFSARTPISVAALDSLISSVKVKGMLYYLKRLFGRF